MSETYIQKNRGVTLIELMISQVLGLVIIAAMMVILVPAIAGFHHNNAISLIQETSRMAMDSLDKVIQQSGYRGCNGNVSYSSPINRSHASVSTRLGNWAYSNFGLRGFAADDLNSINQVFGKSWGKNRYTPGGEPIGDILLTRSTAGAEMELVNHDPDRQTMEFLGNLSTLISKGQIIEINDCYHAATFQIDRNDKPQYRALKNTTTIYYGSDQTINCNAIRRDSSGLLAETGIVLLGGTGNGSCSDESARAGFHRYRFASGSTAHKVLTTTFYLAEDSSSGEPTLYRMGFATNGSSSYSEAIVEGVENIRFLYGQDINGDGTPDSYRNATELNLNPETWRQIVSIHGWLTIRSIADRGRSELNSAIVFPDTRGTLIHCIESNHHQVQACPGSNLESEPGNQRKRRVIEKEFYLRNHLT